MLKSCDLIITACDAYARDIQMLAPKGTPVRAIPVGSNVERVSVSVEEADSLKKRYRLNGSRVLGSFGRFVTYKNYFTMVRMIQAAVGRGIASKLLLIGVDRSANPQYFDDLLKFAERLGVGDRIVMTGRLPAREVSQHLQLFDLFLFPQEGGIGTKSATVISALQHGLPILAYAPAPGHFEGYRLPWGALVSPHRESLFIDEALHFLEQFEASEEKEQEIIRYYQDHFSWPRICDQFQNEIQACET